jgi:methylmalonyl-CoA mutase cobalamin-binding domain/chain
MNAMNVLERVTRALATIDFEAAPQACRAAVDAGCSPKEVVDALSRGMDIIGQKFEAREYFLSELIMAGEIFREAQEIIRPYLTTDDVAVLGKVVIGTVEGDLHDIGKNIVVTLLRAEGFKVTDLGINTPAAAFIDAVRRVKPDVVGLSALLRATVPQMGRVIEALEMAGLRGQVMVIVGGLPLNEDYAKQLNADYYAKDAWLGVKIIKRAVGST